MADGIYAGCDWKDVYRGPELIKHQKRDTVFMNTGETTTKNLRFAGKELISS